MIIYGKIVVVLVILKLFDYIYKCYVKLLLEDLINFVIELVIEGYVVNWVIEKYLC